MKRHLRDDFSRARKPQDISTRFNAAADGLSPATNDNLPRWDLSALYPGLQSAELKEDLATLEDRAVQFYNDYNEGVAQLTGPELGAAIAEYEVIENIRTKITCYIGLLEADNLNNFSKTESLKKEIEEISENTGFFEEELLGMTERELMTKLAAPGLAHYAPWLARVRAGRIDAIDGDVASLSSEYASANSEAWRRLYHETLQGLRVEVGGKKISLDDAYDLFGEPGVKTIEERAALREKMGEALEQNGKRMALIYNTMMRDTLIWGETRKYSRPDHDENAGNQLTDETVDTMAATVKAHYSKLSHRFYAWKAKQHDVEVMPRAQLGMPIPGAPKKAAEYSFDEARRTILRAFKKFSPKFARIAQKFFDNKRIDAQPRPEKETGAFAMPTGPENFPYVFMSYTGDRDSLVTLGHELGHGVHQVLAEKTRGLFLSEMSTAVSETASIFAEMLVFEEMLAKEKDPAQRKILLKDKVEGMILNSMQQLSYYDFERKAHEARKKGELSVEDISDIWIQTQKEYFGPAVETDKYDRYYWMAVPHFFDTPFYVYSYSFAQNMVSGLYQVYKAAEKEGPEAKQEFVDNYIALLETGITRDLHESVRPFDLDPETPEFWQKGLSLIDKYLNELEKLDAVQAAPARKPKGPKAA
ncbi:MAG TPA: M3 family metallopeptidase [Patescibacteria group bacterium]|nr:M3 family metallopeptidase [Patescibacteria group bacterium]